MQLEDSDIREFADLWQAEFHETIGLGEARQHASQLLELYSLLYLAPESPPKPDGDPPEQLP